MGPIKVENICGISRRRARILAQCYKALDDEDQESIQIDNSLNKTKQMKTLFLTD